MTELDSTITANHGFSPSSSQDFLFKLTRQKCWALFLFWGKKNKSEAHFRKGQTVYSSFTKPGSSTSFPLIHPAHHGLVQII